MPMYVIEREISNAGKLTDEEWSAISQTSNAILRQLGPDVQWIESFVTDNKVYCVYIAANEDLIREHARLTEFPANMVSAVGRVINPTTAE